MRVLIVGAGPTGCALAYLLARRGLDVLLLERETAFDRIFRGEALMPSGVDALAQMGLEEPFRQLPQRHVECLELFVDGDRVLRADWPEIRGPNAACIVSQPALLELLTAAASRHSHFDIRMGTTVRSLDLSADGVRLHLRSDGTDTACDGDFLIGADGRGSIVRTKAGLRFERYPFPFDVAWFTLPLPPTQRDDPRFQAFYKQGRTVVVYPSWDGNVRLGLNIPATESRGLSHAPKAELLAKVREVIEEPYAAFIRDHIEDISGPTVLKVLFGRCPQWFAPRTLLLGDAAHAMSPVRAQGINLALRDAIVTANHLVPALEAQDVAACEAAAERIQKEREPEIIESQRLQVMTAEPPAPMRVAMFRSVALPVLQRLGVMKRLFLRSELPLRHGVVPVKLAV